MAGLYIHIPFCSSRCVYCGFYSTTRNSMHRRYTDALCREIELRRGYAGEDIHTIYIGGGTPSMLSEELLQQIFGCIGSCGATEVTMECNPDDVTPAYAAAISRLPVNRVSMGAQTFDDARLAFLRRRHKAADTARAVETLRRAGIGNISIDLMYGFPGETGGQWLSDIKAAMALGVEHISAYCLMYEEGTPLFRMLEQGKVEEIDDELSARMYYTLKDELENAGYEHYEISNFAKPGRRSQHNSSYWTGIPYTGIGAAAHSFDGSSRQWNVADIDSYIDSIGRGIIPAEREELDLDTRYNDYVMLRLRTCEGIDAAAVRRDFGEEHLDYCLASALRHIESGLLETAGSCIRLSRRGLFLSDMVMSDLMRI